MKKKNISYLDYVEKTGSSKSKKIKSILYFALLVLVILNALVQKGICENKAESMKFPAEDIGEQIEKSVHGELTAYPF